MARHKRTYSGDRCTAPIRVHVTPRERDRLKARAAGHGASLSAYGREVLVSREPVVAGVRRNPEAAALCEQVRALGVNLNQIAHHMNATGTLDDVPELRELCREIKAVFAHILDL